MEKSISVKSADRALALLELFNDHQYGLTLSEVCSLTGWPKSSSLALLRTLQQRSFLEVSRSDAKYRLGPRIASLGMAYLQNLDIVVDGGEIVRSVSRACDETVHLAILRGSEVMYIAKEEGGGEMRMVSSVGRAVPAHATGVGKVLLAALSTEDLHQLYSPGESLPFMTPRTITHYEQLLEALTQTRSRGYATDDGESTIGVRCIAAPVFDVEGSVVAAMSVSIPEPRYTDDRVQPLFDHLITGARRLSLRMGCPLSHLPHRLTLQESVVNDGVR